MKKFIEMVFAFVVIVVVATLIAILFGMDMSEGQKMALFGFCFGGCLLAIYRILILEEKQ